MRASLWLVHVNMARIVGHFSRLGFLLGNLSKVEGAERMLFVD